MSTKPTYICPACREPLENFDPREDRGIRTATCHKGCQFTKHHVIVQRPAPAPRPQVFKDIHEFHQKFGLGNLFNGNVLATGVGVYEGDFAPEEWELRHARLKEELDEYLEAVEAGDDEGTFDALIDLCYIAIGTCYRRGWDFEEGWRRVHAANMAKERGKENSSKYGSSFDIVKPEGWTAPDLSDLVTIDV